MARGLGEVPPRKEEPDALMSSAEAFRRSRRSAGRVGPVLVAVLRMKRQGLCRVAS